MTEPKHEVMRKYNCRVMNSVHDVSANEVFEVLLTNFSSHPQQLPKGMVIAYGSRSPLALIHLTGEAAREVLDGHGLRYAVEDMQERDVAENLAEEDDAEKMHIIKLVDEQLEYQRKPFCHENQILAITGKDLSLIHISEPTRPY